GVCPAVAVLDIIPLDYEMRTKVSVVYRAAGIRLIFRKDGNKIVWFAFIRDIVAIANPAEVIKSDITRAGDVKLRVAVLVKRKRERQRDGIGNIVPTIDAGVGPARGVNPGIAGAGERVAEIVAVA